MSAALREAFLRGASWGRRNANDLGYFKPSAEAAAKAHYPPKTETRPRVITLKDRDGDLQYRVKDGRLEVADAKSEQWTSSGVFKAQGRDLVLFCSGFLVTQENTQALLNLIRNPTETVEVAE